MVITNVNNTNIASATITLSNRLDGDTIESLSVNSALPAGITASSYNQGTGTITLTGSATLADYQTAIAQIEYNNTSTNPNTTARSVTVKVNDGNSDSNTGTTTINIIATNSPPVVNSSAITVDEASQDTGLGLTAPTDADGDTLTITVTGLPTLGQVTKADGTAVNNGDSLTSEELTRLLYDAPSDYDGTDDPGDFTYNVSDGTTTVSGRTDITITQVNDSPTLDLDGDNSSGATGNDYTTTFIEGGSTVPIGDNGNVVITDVDDTNIESATITLTNRLDGNTVESLSVNSTLPAGITASSCDSATGIITLTGSCLLYTSDAADD